MSGTYRAAAYWAAPLFERYSPLLYLLGHYYIHYSISLFYSRSGVLGYAPLFEANILTNYTIADSPRLCSWEKLAKRSHSLVHVKSCSMLTLSLSDVSCFESADGRASKTTFHFYAV